VCAASRRVVEKFLLLQHPSLMSLGTTFLGLRAAGRSPHGGISGWLSIRRKILNLLRT
jgi:hypothetical protein